MTLTSFVIIVLIAFIGAVILIELATLPGKKAKERGHPQAEAIAVLGWVGLLFGGVAWLVALVWAYTRPAELALATESRPPDDEASASAAE